MKSSLSFFLLLVFLFIVSNVPTFSSAAQIAVFDAAGKKLRVGTRYYIYPKNRTTGGIQLESLDDKPCPLDIVLEDQVPGLPVSFYPKNYKKGVVRVLDDVNIEFPTAYAAGCPNSSWWTIDICPLTGNYLLATGGQRGNPEPSTVRNWFKIMNAADYKLVHCPTPAFNATTCKNVGIVVQDGKRRLGLTDVPLSFVLKKA